MRASTLLLAGPAVLLAATAALALAPSPTTTPGPRDLPDVGDPGTPNVPNPIHVDQGGDTIASALPITALPFTDSGSSVGYADDYAGPCAFSEPHGPDVVYSFTPSTDTIVVVRVRAPSWKLLYVYEDIEGNVIACDSWEVNVALAAGHTYYIIVDTHPGLGSPFDITVNAAPVPCVVTCPTGYPREGEPECDADYEDHFNGGCSSTPPIFTWLGPFHEPEIVCGQYGGFSNAGVDSRDTDWYQIYVWHDQTELSWTVRGESETLCGIVDGRVGCPVTSFYSYATGPACTDVTTSATLDVGLWWLWAGTLGFGSEAGPCGQNYVATVHCPSCMPVAVEPRSWGKIKSEYR